MLRDEAEARAWLAANFDERAIHRLELFEAALREENTRQNLVSRSSISEVWRRHFADSAQLVRLVPRGTRWLDLGTGAGFPGFIVAICEPDRVVVLVESRKRRADWLASAAARLKLTNVTVQGGRLENVPTWEAGVISARAFAPLPDLLRVSARFSTPQTLWVLPKGRGGRKELSEMPTTVQDMFHVEQSLTDPESVILVGKGRLAGLTK